MRSLIVVNTDETSGTGLVRSARHPAIPHTQAADSRGLLVTCSSPDAARVPTASDRWSPGRTDSSASAVSGEAKRESQGGRRSGRLDSRARRGTSDALVRSEGIQRRFRPRRATRRHASAGPRRLSRTVVQVDIRVASSDNARLVKRRVLVVVSKWTVGRNPCPAGFPRHLPRRRAAGHLRDHFHLEPSPGRRVLGRCW